MKVIAIVMVSAVALSGCRLRTANASAAASTKQPVNSFLGLGICEIEGDLPSAMTFDRIEITLPYAPKDLASADVVKNTARIEMVGQPGLKIDEGLDLYDRSGLIAMVSGAKVGPAPDYHVEFSIKVSLAANSEASRGFAVIDGDLGKAMVPVNCTWNERTDLNIAEIQNGGVDAATLNPNPEGGFQLVSSTMSPLICR